MLASFISAFLYIQAKKTRSGVEAGWNNQTLL